MNKSTFQALAFAINQPVADYIIEGIRDSCEFGVPTRVRGDVVLGSPTRPQVEPHRSHGCLLGVVTLVDCVELQNPSRWEWRVGRGRRLPHPPPHPKAAPLFLV